MFLDLDMIKLIKCFFKSCFVDICYYLWIVIGLIKKGGMVYVWEVWFKGF